MPGFNTHYFFGINTLKHLDDCEVKVCCKQHPQVYALGLQGPDVFFYFVIAGFLDRKNIGSLVHVSKTNEFFTSMFESLSLFDTPSAHRSNPQARETAIAYMAGFLGHYLLDANAHPFIYARTDYNRKDNSYYGRHVFLETDIDHLLLEKYTGKLPSEFKQEKIIKMSKAECRVVTDLLYETYHKTYPAVKAFRPLMQTALHAMPLFCHLLRDKYGRKKAWARKIEEIIFGYPIISPLIASDTLLFCRDPFNLRREQWNNPWDESVISNSTFFELMTVAEQEYLDILNYFTTATSNDAQVYHEPFLEMTGNRSYHSGLDCSIPS
ncbi:MAG TPA: zinc dependent phospholipase C family protein [Lachnospiraceae bacterium]|nr:zinc dependent phospholipase C family protein [Lachnospiraceae bacterium]